MARLRCPHCVKAIGGRSREGGVRLRLSITLLDEDGTVHGPCPHCKGDVIVASDADLTKALRGPQPLVVVRLPRPG